MTTSKRMALAFGCMLLAFAIFVIRAVVPIAVRYGPRHALPALQILPLYLVLTLLGWVLALPFVILFKHADGWRTWAMLAIGTAIGPFFFVAWALLASGSMTWQGDGPAVAMSLFIGFLTTVFYVAALRFFTRHTPGSSS